MACWGITSDVIFVGGVDFFYSSVAEGQLSHPVHAPPHTRGQTQVGTGGSRVEPVSAEVIRAEMKRQGEGADDGLGTWGTFYLERRDRKW